MSGFRYLSAEEIFQLHDAALKSGLAGMRGGVLAGLELEVASQLAAGASPSAQCLLDLNHLNQLRGSRSGRVPLADWLKAAEVLVGPRLESQVFREMRARVLTLAGGLP